MASPRRSTSSRELPLLAAACLLLSGCNLPFLTSGVEGGMLVGAIEWGGRPAPGKTVHLLKLDGSSNWSAYRPSGTLVTATTNDAGVYTFTDLPDGSYMVQYLAAPVLDAQGNRIGPSEVADWRTPGTNVSGSSGGRLNPFEVTFNGLIYPESGRNYQVNAGAPLPFHWATHLRATRYRVVIYHPAVGGQPSNKVYWSSDITNQPSALLNQKVAPGNYTWEVEILSDAGKGHSVRRNLDLSTPLPQEPEEPVDDPGEEPFPEE